MKYMINMSKLLIVFLAMGIMVSIAEVFAADTNDATEMTTSISEEPKDDSNIAAGIATGNPEKSVGDSSDNVQYVQSKLTELGYNPGPIDGVMGDKTRIAIIKYQKNTGESATGKISDELVKYLNEPCTQKIVDGTVHQHGGCQMPKDLAPGVKMHSGTFTLKSFGVKGFGAGTYIGRPTKK